MSNFLGMGRKFRVLSKVTVIVQEVNEHGSKFGKKLQLEIESIQKNTKYDLFTDPKITHMTSDSTGRQTATIQWKERIDENE